MIKKTFLMTSLLSLFALQSEARTEIEYGLAPSLQSIKVSDPDGKTESATNFTVLSFVARTPTTFRRYTNWLGEMSHDEYSLDASTTKIGQEIGRWNIGGGLETRIPVSRGFDFYAGAILGLSQSEFASRHTIDSDGFLLERYSKRSESIPYLKLQAAYYHVIDRDWSVGVVPSYEFGLGDGVDSLSLKAVFYY